MDINSQLVWIAAAWIGYGLLHSLFASRRLKIRVMNRYPGYYRYYRLGYNLLATLLLLPPLWLLYSYPGEPLWARPTYISVIANLAGLAALIGLLWSSRCYDNSEFLGLKQLCNDAGEAEPLRISPLHRWVRHPWYFFGLVILWTREMNAALLMTALILTAYLIIGSQLEERKLIEAHGERYRAYRRRVPGLMPWPWRHLSARQAAELTDEDEARASEPDRSSRQ